LKVRILSEADCRSLMNMAEAIEVQSDAFSLLGNGASVDGLRSVARSDCPPGVVIFNPCFLRGGAGFGVKVVADFYRNGDRGLPRMNALLALFDGESGLPRTILEAGYITDLRTGAGTALAARHLARRDSRVLGLIGVGRVARNQLQALAAEFPLERILVHARRRDAGDAFALWASECIGLKGKVVAASAEQTIMEADIVVAATTSTEPVVLGEWLRPGAFVACVGGHAATMREIDSEGIRRAAFCVIDSRADCLDRAGDYVIPISEGILARDDVVAVSDIVTGRRPGRRREDEIIVYKSSGAPIQDILTAQRMAERAASLGMGIEVEIGGDHD
jgi:ornithine cyclodeaminase/alanine dehydrogenase-like protein (mu-crystallin family)